MNPRSVYENYLRSITAKRDSLPDYFITLRPSTREMARHATPYTLADMGNSFTVKLLKGFYHANSQKDADLPMIGAVEVDPIPHLHLLLWVDTSKRKMTDFHEMKSRCLQAWSDVILHSFENGRHRWRHMPFQTYQDAEIASKIALDPDCDSLHIEPYNKFLGEDAGASSYIKKRLWDSAKPEQLYANGYANDYYERELEVQSAK